MTTFYQLLEAQFEEFSLAHEERLELEDGPRRRRPGLARDAARPEDSRHRARPPSPGVGEKDHESDPRHQDAHDAFLRCLLERGSAALSVLGGAGGGADSAGRAGEAAKEPRELGPAAPDGVRGGSARMPSMRSCLEDRLRDHDSRCGRQDPPAPAADGAERPLGSARSASGRMRFVPVRETHPAPRPRAVTGRLRLVRGGNRVQMANRRRTSDSERKPEG